MDLYKIRKAKESEIDSFIEWGKSLGWNMEAEFIKNYYIDYPNGWFVGELNTELEDGKIDTKIIAKLYCTKYPSKIGFIGYYIVDEQYRGKAYGYQLIKYVLDKYLNVAPITKTMQNHTNSEQFESVAPSYCKAVGLVSAPLAIPYYEKFGFKLVDQTVRFTGVVGEKLLKNCEYNNGVEILLESVTKFDLETVSKYDTSFSQAYRPGIWNNWGTIFPKDHCLVYKNPEDGTIQGLGAIRPLPIGYRMGPLYASTSDIAHQIFSKLCRSLPESSIVNVNALESNSEAMKFFKGVGLDEDFKAGYMWKGEDEEIAQVLGSGKGLYALATLAFN